MKMMPPPTAPLLAWLSRSELLREPPPRGHCCGVAFESNGQRRPRGIWIGGIWLWTVVDQIVYRKCRSFVMRDGDAFTFIEMIIFIGNEDASPLHRNPGLIRVSGRCRGIDL